MYIYIYIYIYSSYTFIDRYFPGCPLVETPYSKCRGPSFNPWSQPAIKSFHAEVKRSCMLQQRSKIQPVTTKTPHSQINKY